MTRWFEGMGARGWRRRSHSRVPIWERVGVGNGNRRWNKGFSVPRKARSQRLCHRRESKVFPHFPRFPAFPYYVGCTSKEVHPLVGGRTAGTQRPSSPSAYRGFPTISFSTCAFFCDMPAVSSGLKKPTSRRTTFQGADQGQISSLISLPAKIFRFKRP